MVNGALSCFFILIGAGLSASGFDLKIELSGSHAQPDRYFLQRPLRLSFSVVNFPNI
jgi:hypothetical protein